MDVRYLKTFVAAGAVGGLSAAFGIPLAGVFFTMEVILKDFANEAFPAVVVSSVTGAVVARALLRDAVMAPLLTYEWVWTRNLPLYAGLGLFCAVLGRAYSRSISGLERVFGRWERIPDWTRPGVGGLLVGLIETFLGSRFAHDLVDPLVYGILLIVLLVRPQGIFGSKRSARD